MNIAASRAIFAILSRSIESGGSRRVFTKRTRRSSWLCPVVDTEGRVLGVCGSEVKMEGVQRSPWS